MEAKKLRKVLVVTLERLDNETRRAQEAERRALELAQRFKMVNDARNVAQQGLDRAHAELRLYKIQLENAQREIDRGSDLLRDIEAQRDSAEASAARARSTARRLKEEQLVLKAREEGRKEGYREGLERGYQQARVGGVDDQQFAVPPAGLPPLSGMSDGPMRPDPLDGFSVLNLSSPPAPAHVNLSSAFGAASQDASALPSDPYGPGAEGSRFHEHMGSPGASTLRSAALDVSCGCASERARVVEWGDCADAGWKRQTEFSDLNRCVSDAATACALVVNACRSSPGPARRPTSTDSYGRQVTLLT